VINIHGKTDEGLLEGDCDIDVEVVPSASESGMRSRDDFEVDVPGVVVWALVAFTVKGDGVPVGHAFFDVDENLAGSGCGFLSFADGALRRHSFPLTTAMGALLLHLLEESGGNLMLGDHDALATAVAALLHVIRVFGSSTSACVAQHSFLDFKLKNLAEVNVLQVELEIHVHVRTPTLLGLTTTATCKPET